jgi:transposase-like protein
MKARRLCLGLLLLVGCAGTRGARFATSTGESHWDTCFPGRHYSEEQTAAIQEMREEGASYKQIAGTVGGKPQDLRCWAARVRGRALEGPQMATAARR